MDGVFVFVGVNVMVGVVDGLGVRVIVWVFVCVDETLGVFVGFGVTLNVTVGVRVAVLEVDDFVGLEVAPGVDIGPRVDVAAP